MPTVGRSLRSTSLPLDHASSRDELAASQSKPTGPPNPLVYIWLRVVGKLLSGELRRAERWRLLADRSADDMFAASTRRQDGEQTKATFGLYPTPSGTHAKRCAAVRRSLSGLGFGGGFPFSARLPGMEWSEDHVTEQGSLPVGTRIWRRIRQTHGSGETAHHQVFDDRMMPMY